MCYTVKEIAEKTGVTEYTIRYYTDLNLLPCKRDANNHRVFEEDAIICFNGIKSLKKGGMSIEDIKRYGELCQLGKKSIKERYAILAKQKEEASKKLAEAKAMYNYMLQKVKRCEEIINKNLPDDMNIMRENFSN